MNEASIEEDLDPEAALAAFDALDNSSNGVVEVAPPAPKRKRSPAKKKSTRSRKSKSNGAVHSGEILDENGNPMQPPA